MTEKEIALYLLRYLMEFGSEPTTAKQRMDSAWYASGGRVIINPAFIPYVHEFSIGKHEYIALN